VEEARLARDAERERLERLATAGQLRPPENFKDARSRAKEKKAARRGEQADGEEH
jgi:hypothetical protein